MSKDDLSTINEAANDLAGWCYDTDLIFNVNKTKELFLCNLDNPIHDMIDAILTTNGSCVEQVESLKYLHVGRPTVLDKKLRFQENKQLCPRKLVKDCFWRRNFMPCMSLNRTGHRTILIL